MIHAMSVVGHGRIDIKGGVRQGRPIGAQQEDVDLEEVVDGNHLWSSRPLHGEGRVVAGGAGDAGSGGGSFDEVQPISGRAIRMEVQVRIRSGLRSLFQGMAGLQCQWSVGSAGSE